jgi:TonB family protein
MRALHHPLGFGVAGAFALLLLGAGTLERDVIREVVRAEIDDVRACYEVALADDPALSGTIVVSFTVGEGGAVSNARVLEDDVGAGVGACLVGAIGAWRFPGAEGRAPVSVTYPFRFEPG